MNASATPIRVGLIVPSSNVTIETELPALLARHKFATFTFHSSRMRMQDAFCRRIDERASLRQRRNTILSFSSLLGSYSIIITL